MSPADSSRCARSSRRLTARTRTQCLAPCSASIGSLTATPASRPPRAFGRAPSEHTGASLPCSRGQATRARCSAAHRPAPAGMRNGGEGHASGIGYLRPLEKCSPGGLEADVDREHPLGIPCLLFPLLQHLECLGVQRYVPRLLILRYGSFGGELLALRVDRRSAESQKLAAAHAGDHGEQHHGREMIAVVRQDRQPVLLPCPAPTIRPLASVPYFLGSFPESSTEPFVFRGVRVASLGAAVNPRPFHAAHDVLEGGLPSLTARVSRPERVMTSRRMVRVSAAAPSRCVRQCSISSTVRSVSGLA